jgi:phospholipase C
MLTRRNFLRVLGGTAGLTLGGSRLLLDSVARAATQPSLTSSATGIDHVVVLMLENRSFDHLLGWLSGADGKQDGTYPALDGNTYPNYPLAPDFQGCGYSDPDHSWEGWLVQNDNGALEGFLRRPTAPPSPPSGAPAAVANTFPIGYYTNLDPGGGPKAVPDIPVLGALAQQYTVIDRYFASFAGETYPNRFYQHAARTDRDHNSTTSSTLPAIWDQLSPVPGTGKPTGAYFFKDVPFLALWGTKYLGFWRPYVAGQSLPGLGVLPGLSFLDSVQQGLLPNVSFVDPAFEDEGTGTSGDYHPLCDIRVGEKFVADVYHALHDAGYLANTVLMITFDEWGGFYDHVMPPTVTDDTDPATVNHANNNRPPAFPGPNYPDYTQLGFRVPAIVVSDFAPRQVVSGGPFEHTSTLAFIESLFGLNHLTARDANAVNLGTVLSGTARTDDPASAIPTSAQVPGPATGPAAACSVSSTRSVSPDPLPPAEVPEFPLPAVAGAIFAGGAGLAALGARYRAHAEAIAEPAAEATL